MPLGRARTATPGLSRTFELKKGGEKAMLPSDHFAHPTERTSYGFIG